MANKKAPKKRSFWSNPFGGLFDFNRDGKEDLTEQWVAHKIFDECAKEAASRSGFLDDEEEDTSWRNFCEDGWKYGLDPEDYDTEEEYENALEEAKTAWRDDCEDRRKYGLDPEHYNTEEEYEEALKKAKTAWRATCEDGWEYDLDPENFDSEEEYEDALEEAKSQRDEWDEWDEWDE